MIIAYLRGFSYVEYFYETVFLTHLRSGYIISTGIITHGDMLGISAGLEPPQGVENNFHHY